MTPTYTLSDLRTKVNYRIKGTIGSTTQNGIINDAVRDVLSILDLRSTKRRVPLSLDGRNLIASESTMGIPTSGERANILEEQNKYYFHAPHDLKENALVDIERRYDKVNEFELTTAEQFHRRKYGYLYQMAVAEDSQMRRLLVSGIQDISNLAVHACNSYNGNGTWAADGVGITAVATVTSDLVEGTGAIGFTTPSGTVTDGTITVSDMTAVDLSDYDDESIYLWIKIPFATGLTSFTLKWGSDASNYFSRTVTKTHDDTAFHVGWNLLRFPWADATETGTVDDDAIDYLQLAVTKGSTNTGTTGWVVDRIIACKDSKHDVIYYSKFGWQTSAGVYIENATGDTDVLNADATELELIILKAAEFCSSFLDVDKDEGKFKVKFDEKAELYGLNNPSERKIIIDTYQSVGSSDTPDNLIDSGTL